MKSRRLVTSWRRERSEPQGVRKNPSKGGCRKPKETRHFGYKATPVEIVGKLNQEINAALADPKIKARLAALGVTILQGSPADFGKLIAEDTEKWAKVVRSANIKPE